MLSTKADNPSYSDNTSTLVSTFNHVLVIRPFSIKKQTPTAHKDGGFLIDFWCLLLSLFT